MLVKAISVGCAFPRECFDGRVHSLFERACNVLLDSGALIAFLAIGQPDSPLGARLDLCALDALALRVDQPVACRQSVVRFVGINTQIDLSTANQYSGDVTSLRINMGLPSTRAAWQAAWTAVQVSPKQDGLGLLHRSTPAGRMAGRAEPVIGALLHATRCRSVESAVMAAARLIGLGPGLTPSGDDFLLGYLAGLWCADESGFARGVGEGVVKCGVGTTLASRVYLEQAAQGRVSSALRDLAAKIVEGATPVEVKSAAHAALRVGGTSGVDGVLGLLMGLSAQGFGLDG